MHANNSAYFVTQDQIGSSTLLTNVSGGVADCNAFYPFGEQDNSICATTNTTTHKFTGEERDSESNLDNFGARYDSSSLGRFMSPDPANAGAVAGNPQSWNAYAYVLNNPETLTDPTGMSSCSNGDWSGCAMDMIDAPCGDVLPYLFSGSAVECPGDVCSGLGNGIYAQFYAFSGGVSGYHNPTELAVNGINEVNGKLVTSAVWGAFVRNGTNHQHSELARRILAEMVAHGITGYTLQDVKGFLSPIRVRGGNADFAWGGPPLTFIPEWANGGCEFACRLGSVPSVHYHDFMFHLDSANPFWGYGLGFLVHFTEDMLLGNINSKVPTGP